MDGGGVVEAAIIGGGPIGIELAAGLKHAGVDSIHFEAGQIGSTIQWWAPGTRFFSSPERIEIAGVPLTLLHQEKASREEYLAYLRGVVRHFDLSIKTYTRVIGIERRGNHFEIVTRRSAHGVGGPDESDELRMTSDELSRGGESGESRWMARRLVLAIGGMHRPRMLGVAGECLPHVSHFLGDPHQYFGRRVLIVGGKNSAVEAALRLYRGGAHVAISYRGSEFDQKRVKYWLRPELEWLVSKSKIEFHPHTVVAAIAADHVTLVPVEGNHGGVSGRRVEADCVLLLTGYVQDTVLFEQLGVTLEGDERAAHFDEQTMETNVPGVYVAGTAAAGSQKRAKLFIENTHVHVRNIVRSIAGKDVPWTIEREDRELEQ